MEYLSFNSCDAQAFKTDGKLGADDILMKSVEEYFRAGYADSTSKIRRTQLPSIYFQHPGMATRW